MANEEQPLGTNEVVVESDAADLSVIEKHRKLVEQLAKLKLDCESMRGLVTADARYELGLAIISLRKAVSQLENCGNALPESERIIEQISEQHAALIKWAPSVKIFGAQTVDEIRRVLIRRGLGRWYGSTVALVLAEVEIPERVAADLAFRLLKILTCRFDVRVHGGDFQSWAEKHILTCFRKLSSRMLSIENGDISEREMVHMVEGILAIGSDFEVADENAQEAVES